ncbi:MAG: carbonic anhydrase, partial [Gemmatimonadetes bacterium]|nr:carbonic anhydrase [Gemmatimonadota bacterium]
GTVEPRGAVTDPNIALERLQAGNQRYVAGQPLRFRLDDARRIELVEGQTPLATVFACVDSRVPVERVFDQAHGELLVVRTAAHVVDQAALGSVEFGVAQLNTPLVVVMGHQRCGAVAAALSFAETGTRAPGSIQAIVDGIGPAVAATRGQGTDPLEDTVRRHSQMIADQVAQSPVINPMLQQGRVRIVPAYYSMRTGRVEFLAA